PGARRSPRQGADVTKVEPRSGDWSRLMGGGRDGMTAMSVSANIGKKAVCIDAGKPEGRDLILRMAERADVVIESFRPGVMERLGLQYERIAERNPGVIYVSGTGFGRDGPARDLPGAESPPQALSGRLVMHQG